MLGKHFTKIPFRIDPQKCFLVLTEEKKSKAFQCMFPILQTFLNSAKEIVLETRNNLILVIVVRSGLQGWPHYITGGQLKPECFWKIDIFLSSLPGEY